MFVPRNPILQRFSHTKGQTSLAKNIRMLYSVNEFAYQGIGPDPDFLTNGMLFIGYKMSGLQVDPLSSLHTHRFPIPIPRSPSYDSNFSPQTSDRKKHVSQIGTTCADSFCQCRFSCSTPPPALSRTHAELLNGLRVEIEQLTVDLRPSIEPRY